MKGKTAEVGVTEIEYDDSSRFAYPLSSILLPGTRQAGTPARSALGSGTDGNNLITPDWIDHVEEFASVCKSVEVLGKQLAGQIIK